MQQFPTIFLACCAILALATLPTVKLEATEIAPFCSDYAYKMYEMCGSQSNCTVTSTSAICVCPPSAPYSVVECVRRGHTLVGGGGVVTGLSWNELLPNWNSKSDYLAPFVPGTIINLQTIYVIGGLCDQNYDLRITQGLVSNWVASGSTGLTRVNIIVDSSIFEPGYPSPVLELRPAARPGNPFCLPSLLEIAGHFRI